MDVRGSNKRLVFLQWLAGAWLALAVSGSVVLARYSYTPTPSGEPARRWPRSSTIHLREGHFTLVLLAHPRCPCTAATLEELSQLLAVVPLDRLDVHALFLLPASFPKGWERTSLWRTAKSIPGVTVWLDPDGREARLFLAKVSGQVLLYDSSGELRYAGGITAGRGHAGDNPGLEAVRGLLKHPSTPGAGEGFSRAPVFGCSLR
jgi:hypothetical protein